MCDSGWVHGVVYSLMHQLMPTQGATAAGGLVGVELQYMSSWMPYTSLLGTN
jgi:hypothetical protein